MSEPNWKRFERLVATLHRADATGTEVHWNEKISGRQFDVVIRFSVGAYRYLTVVECKDQDRSVPVCDVEAFVIKARDAGADKAVVVSRSGFQEGAFDIAKRHNIELFSLTYIEEVSEELLSEDLIPSIRVYDARFFATDIARWIVLPEDRGLPAYLETHLLVSIRGKQTTLLELIDSTFNAAGLRPTSSPSTRTATLEEGSTAYFPHLRQTHPVNALEFTYKLDSLRALKQPGIDPTLVSGTYEYRDLRTGQVRRFPKYALQLEYDTVFREGTFYFEPTLEYSYYCHRLKGSQARMFLVESYQHGTLVQVIMTMDTKFQRRYVEITDADEIQRLRRVAATMFKDQGVV
jgi:hypothetical protein